MGVWARARGEGVGSRYSFSATPKIKNNFGLRLHLNSHNLIMILSKLRNLVGYFGLLYWVQIQFFCYTENEKNFGLCLHPNSHKLIMILSKLIWLLPFVGPVSNLHSGIFIAAKVNMSDVCYSHVKILFMLQQTTVFFTMQNYWIMEVLNGLYFSSPVEKLQLFV